MCKAKSPPPAIVKPEKPKATFNAGGMASAREDAMGSFAPGSRDSLRIDSGATPKAQLFESDKPIDYQYQEDMARYRKQMTAYLLAQRKKKKERGALPTVAALGHMGPGTQVAYIRSTGGDLPKI